MSRAWTRTLLVVELLIGGAATLGVVAGVVLVLTDSSDGTEKFDGLLTFLGLVVGVVSLLVAGVAFALAALTRRSLRSDDVRLRRWAGLVPAGLATTWLVGVAVAAVQGAEAPGVALAVLAGLVVLVPALGTAVPRHPTV